ncbi:MAG: hypothetical protein C5B59_15960 [Bacteroidetes bacterium]|nr:MAG: hypothetical protein C5B59_15960 [Bacteroidota bacterium]
MEAIIDLLKSFQLNAIEVTFIAFAIFCVGFWIGNKKVKKLTQEIYGLQRDVLELNEDLLTSYGSTNRDTPVIDIKQDKLKIGSVAK